MSLFIFLFSAFIMVPIESHSNTIDYSGEWAYNVETPQGPYSGSIILEKAFDGYTGHIQSGEFKIDMSDIIVEGTEMKFKIMVDGFPVSISGKFEGDTYNAVASVEGMEIPLIAKRKR